MSSPFSIRSRARSFAYDPASTNAPQVVDFALLVRSGQPLVPVHQNIPPEGRPRDGCPGQSTELKPLVRAGRMGFEVTTGTRLRSTRDEALRGGGEQGDGISGGVSGRAHVADAQHQTGQQALHESGCAGPIALGRAGGKIGVLGSGSAHRRGDLGGHTRRRPGWHAACRRWPRAFS